MKDYFVSHRKGEIILIIFSKDENDKFMDNPI